MKINLFFVPSFRTQWRSRTPVHNPTIGPLEGNPKKGGARAASSRIRCRGTPFIERFLFEGSEGDFGKAVRQGKEG